MPTFRITAPDGATYRVDAPEGATEAEALERVKAQVAGAGQQQRTPSLSDVLGQYAQPEAPPPAPGLPERAKAGAQRVLGLGDAVPAAPAAPRATGEQRGKLRAVQPYVAAEPDTRPVLERPYAGDLPPLSDVEMAAGSRQPAAPVARSPGAFMGPSGRTPVDRLSDAAGEISPALGRGVRSVADTEVAIGRIVPQTAKLAADIVQLVTLGGAKPLSDAMRAWDEGLGGMQSTQQQNASAQFQALLQDGRMSAAQVTAFLLQNPEFTLNTAIPSVGSMAVALGGAKAGGMLATHAAQRAGLVGEELAAARALGAERGATAANMAMNAGSTFDETRGGLGARLAAAGGAAAGALAMGKLTGGGAEAQLAAGARRLSQNPVANALGNAGVAMGREGAQEAGEQLSQDASQALAEGRPLDARALGKSASAAGIQGALLGVAGAGTGSRGIARDGIHSAIDEAANRYGLAPAASAALRDAIVNMPEDQAVGYVERALAGFERRNLSRKAGVVTGFRDALTARAQAAEPAEQSSAPAALEAVVRQQVAGETGDLSTTQQQVVQPLAPAADDTAPIDASELLGTPTEQPAAAQAPVVGDPINRNWTAFAPESGTLGIPREQMPQVPAERRGALVNFLAARGVAREQTDVPAADLKPAQAEFSPAKVARAGEAGGDRSILVSSDGYVLDGHHQWLAAREAGKPVKAIRLDAPIQDLLRLTHQFPSSTTAPGAKRAPAAEADQGGAAPAVEPLQPGAAPAAAPAQTAAPATAQPVAPAAPEPQPLSAIFKKGDTFDLDGQPVRVADVRDKALIVTVKGGRRHPLPVGSDSLQKLMNQAQGRAAQKPVILQNRDRSTPGSIEQMQSIAKAPDYTRLGFSRDFTQGAPVVAGGSIPAAQLGRQDKAAAGSRQIPVQYAVLEAADVLASNRADGTPIQDYATASDRVRAIAGNGRIAGLQMAHRRGKAKAYAQELVADDMHGISPDVIRAMKAPVLVRVMPASEITPDIGDISNTTGTLQLSATEQARNDAQRIDLAGLEFAEDGSFSGDTVNRFVLAMPQSERGSLADKDGQPTRQAHDRLAAAVFATAYDSDALIRLYAQAADPEARNVLSALAQAAPAMARLKDAGALDIRPIVAEAAEAAVTARKRGLKLSELAAQVDMAADPDMQTVLALFAQHARSVRPVAEALQRAADMAYAEAMKPGADMFGEVPRATRGDVLDQLQGNRREGSRPQGVEDVSGRKPAGPDAGGQAAGAGRPADAGQAQAGRPAEEEGLSLAAQTPEDLKAKAEREAAAQERERAKKAAEQERLRKQAEDRENRARADATRDDFQLGQSADQQMSGMGDMFAEPAAAPALPPKDKPQASKNAIFTEDAAAKARKRLRKKLSGSQLNSGIDPEIMLDGITLAGYHVERGARTFAAYAQAMLSDLGDAVRPYLKSWYMGMRYDPRAAGFDGMSSAAEVDAADVDTIAADQPQGENDVPGTDADLERDRQDAGAAAPAVGQGVRGEGPADSTSAALGGARSEGPGRQDGQGLDAGGSASAGERGNQPVDRGQRAAGPAEFPARTDDGQRSDDHGVRGVPPETVSAEQVAGAAVGGLDAARKLKAQREAESAPVKTGDLESVRATLPYLLPGQQEDVHKAETRFAAPDGYGILFTNGTGTGKTFSGLGVVKRFQRQGKTSTLIVVPDAKIASDWIESGEPLGLKIAQLQDTKDAGRGIVITTYANLGMNDALATRAWDLVVADEAHTLMQSADGGDTLALDALRAITMHPRGEHTRYTMLNRDDIERATWLGKEIEANGRIISNPDTMDAMVGSLRDENARMEAERKTIQARLDAARAAVRKDVADAQGAKRTRAVFLSATPFAYEKTVDWSEGYLFSYDEGQPADGPSGTAGRGYNSGTNRDRFFVQHFGYRMRYNKLTEPDAKVDRGLMQRQFNGWLRRRGALSARVLDVPADYDRRFVLTESAIGNQIDRAIQWVRDQDKARAKTLKDQPGAANGFALLAADLDEALFGKLGHLTRRYLLEAIKAKEVIPDVRAHLAMGRKVVVFHDFKKGGSLNPFNFRPRQVPHGPDVTPEMKVATEAYNEAAAAFAKEFPQLAGGALLQDLISPIERFKREFPGVLLINGDEKPSALLQRYKRFNDDAAGPLVALVQSDKNKGWSGHDTTGKHQRVLFNLGLPTQPTKSIQQEGRIYRTGQVSDALFRYLNTGTTWERWAFAQTIATRSGTTENLGMGEQARALRDAFISAFEESSPDYRAGFHGEGKGGKERDRASLGAVTEWDRAIAFYWGTQQKTAKTKAQEGADYFATPEPLGLKMVRWADARGGESAMEPSGGHGAIARWLGDNLERTVIEPSDVLGSKLALVYDGKIVRGTFEDYHIVNKHDVVAMNPPFGVGGKTAVEHLAKAAQHTRDGGRIVALIPTGPAADKKFEKWFYGTEQRPLKPLMEHPKLGPIYRGDVIKTRASFMPVGRVTRRDAQGALWLKVDGKSSESMVPPAAFEAVEQRGPRAEEFRPAEGLHLVGEVLLPAVTFERAGTQVATRIVIIDKSDQATPFKRVDLTGISDIRELFQRLEDLEFPRRAKVEAAEAEPAPRQAAKAEQQAAATGGETAAQSAGLPVIKHVTGKGKTLEGVILRHVTPKQVEPTAPFSFKKDGGTFVRLKDLEATLKAHPLPGAAQEMPMLSRAGAAPAGVPVEQLRAAVAGITSEWAREPDAPRVHVVATAADLPDDALGALYSLGAVDETRGLRMPDGRVYLVADKLQSVAEGQFVLFHEAYGHHGLRAFLGKAYGREMMLLRQANPKLRAEADAWFAKYGEATIDAAMDRGFTREQAELRVRALATEEALADRAGADTPPSGWRSFMVRLQRALRRLNLDGAADFLERLTEAETWALLRDARKLVREGRAHAYTAPTGGAAPRQAAAASRSTPTLSRTDKAALREFLDGEPVVTLSGDEFGRDGVPLTVKVPKWYEEHGYSTVETPGIGPVHLDRKAVANSLAHGIGRAKSAAFAAVPDVLTRGQIIHSEPMRGARDNGVMHYVAAPVAIGGKAMVEVVLVKADQNMQRMYVHEVILREGLQQPAFKTGADAAEAGVRASAGAGAINTVLQSIYAVKRDDLPPPLSRTATAGAAPQPGLKPSTGLMDRAARMTTGGARPGRFLSSALDTTLAAVDRALSVFGDSYEYAKAGLVDRYGVPEAHSEAKTAMRTRIRQNARKTGEIVDKLRALDRQQSRIAYLWMSDKTADSAAERALMATLPEEPRQVLEQLKRDIDALSLEAVELGLMTRETYERNAMAYLHRSYERYEKGDDGARVARARAVRLLGDQFKGRGLRDDATHEQIATPDWWQRKLRDDRADTSLKGQKFFRLELRKTPDTQTPDMVGGERPRLGNLQKVLYWPVSDPIPRHLADWRNDGVWEARFFDKGAKVGMWRDFTLTERASMGEIQEVKYSIAKTMLQMVRDVETARFLNWVALNESVQDESQLPEGAKVVNASERLTRSFLKSEWVQVPASAIPGTAGLKRYGRLAGRFVPGPIWNDLRQISSLTDQGDLADLYQRMLRAWKISKTALSPVTHTNNVMANFVLADMHDVQARHILTALRTWASHKKDTGAAQLLAAYQDNGGDAGMFNENEINEELFKPLVRELELAVEQQAGTALVTAAQVIDLLHARQFRQAFAALGRTKAAGALWAPKKMMKLYGLEDEVFRLAAFVKAREDGLSDQAAGKFARDSFLNYDITAPWINALRRSALPFAAFTYRAMPMVVKTMAEKPHKAAKYWLLATALNALGYLMVGGDDDQEEKERALLPDEKAGKVWGITPKLIRMPWNDDHGAPVFLDVRRWVPLGDVVDFGQSQSAVPIPPPLMPGGPAVILGEVLLNHSAFTGKELTLGTDTLAEKYGKVADHLWKGFMPNFPGLPGTYSTTALMNAGSGKTDAFGREQASVGQAAASVLGLKVASYPSDVLAHNAKAKAAAEDAEILRGMRADMRQASRKGMSPEEFAARQQVAQEKRQRIAGELQQKMEAARAGQR